MGWDSIRSCTLSVSALAVMSPPAASAAFYAGLRQAAASSLLGWKATRGRLSTKTWAFRPHVRQPWPQNQALGAV